VSTFNPVPFAITWLLTLVQTEDTSPGVAYPAIPLLSPPVSFLIGFNCRTSLRSLTSVLIHGSRAPTVAQLRDLPGTDITSVGGLSKHGSFLKLLC
jgi:hypothetical protein